MAEYDRSRIKQLARQLAEYAQERTPPLPALPQPRQIVPDDFAPEGLCSTEREWLCDQIRFLSRVYNLEWFARQEARGYGGLESVPDDELRTIYKRIGRAIECIKDGTSFEDAGLIEYDADT